MSGDSILVSAVRNEGPFLLEWLAWHRLCGFDRFLIFVEAGEETGPETGAKTGPEIERDKSEVLLAALAAAGVVEVIDNSGSLTATPDHFTRALQRAILRPEVQTAAYAMVLEGDEFLNIRAGKGRVEDLVRATRNADIISPCWRIFGNSGHVHFDDKPVTGRFTRAAPSDHVVLEMQNGFKSLFRPGIAQALRPHRPVLKPEYINGDQPIRWVNGAGEDIGAPLLKSGWKLSQDQAGRTLCEVHHYMVRGNETFLAQHISGELRGSDAGIFNLEHYKRFNLNHVVGPAPVFDARKLRHEMATLLALPGVAQAHAQCVGVFAKTIRENRSRWAKAPETGVLMSSERAASEIALQEAWCARQSPEVVKVQPQQPAPPQNSTPPQEPTPDPNLAPRWLADLRHSEFRRGFYHSDACFAAQFTDRGEEVLIVSFDNLSNVTDPALAREPWGYGFYREEGWSHLGVLAFEKNWYRDESLFDYLEDLAARGFFARFRRVVFTGTSMGGYGATAFCDLCPGATVLAFSPQSTLDKKRVPWEERFGSGRKRNWKGRYADAPECCGKADKVFVIYDPYFEPDRRHAERYTGANVEHLFSWYSSHKSAQFLRRADLLKVLTREAVAGRLTRALYYQLFRSRRELIWYCNGLADHLYDAGHMKLLDFYADWLAQNGRPGLANGIRARL